MIYRYLSESKARVEGRGDLLGGGSSAEDGLELGQRLGEVAVEDVVLGPGESKEKMSSKATLWATNQWAMLTTNDGSSPMPPPS